MTSSSIDNISDDSDIMTWYTKIFCRSFYSTVEENLKFRKDITICCDQLVAEMTSPDDEFRYTASIYATVAQVFKSIDDNVDLLFTVIIMDSISDSLIVFKIPEISMGKAIIGYYDCETPHRIVNQIREVLTKTKECVLKLINAA